MRGVSLCIQYIPRYHQRLYPGSSFADRPNDINHKLQTLLHTGLLHFTLTALCLYIYRNYLV